MIPPGNFWLRVPLAPVTVTEARLIDRCFTDAAHICSSPDKAEDLAAHAVLPCFSIGHEALVGRNDRHAETSLDSRDLITPAVDAQTGFGDARKTGDDPGPFRRVLHLDREGPSGTVTVVDFGERTDIALVLQQTGQSLKLGRSSSSPCHLLTNWPFSHRAVPLRGPCCADRLGTDRSDDTPSVVGRSDGTGCRRAP